MLAAGLWFPVLSIFSNYISATIEGSFDRAMESRRHAHAASRLTFCGDPRLASIPVIDCVRLVQREASSVDSRASPRETATPADSAAVPWSDD